ncbi:MAG: hypothetical protein JNJ88_11810 [Planctomycetes bacterium]|nr:hypothetical protein [Planctomycetota bacterium]
MRIPRALAVGLGVTVLVLIAAEASLLPFSLASSSMIATSSRLDFQGSNVPDLSKCTLNIEISRGLSKYVYTVHRGTAAESLSVVVNVKETQSGITLPFFRSTTCDYSAEVRIPSENLQGHITGSVNARSTGLISRRAFQKKVEGQVSRQIIQQLQRS